MSAWHWSLFAENSTSAAPGRVGFSCSHRQLALANDDEPTITCRACGKRWSFVPDGETPRYTNDDHPSYPNTLDNVGWRTGVRVVMRGVRGRR